MILLFIFNDNGVWFGVMIVMVYIVWLSIAIVWQAVAVGVVGYL